MHILNIEELDFPVQFRPIIRRLKKAVEVKEVRDVMDIDDVFVKEINEYEHRVITQTALYEEERRQKEEAQKKQEEAIILLLNNGISPHDISQHLNLSLDYVRSLVDG
jgi:DNA-directed RNA polymerase specialized sigma24 family protein